MEPKITIYNPRGADTREPEPRTTHPPMCVDGHRWWVAHAWDSNGDGVMRYVGDLCINCGRARESD